MQYIKAWVGPPLRILNPYLDFPHSINPAKHHGRPPADLYISRSDTRDGTGGGSSRWGRDRRTAGSGGTEAPEDLELLVPSYPVGP